MEFHFKKKDFKTMIAAATVITLLSGALQMPTLAETYDFLEGCVSGDVSVSGDSDDFDGFGYISGGEDVTLPNTSGYIYKSSVSGNPSVSGNSTSSDKSKGFRRIKGSAVSTGGSSGSGDFGGPDIGGVGFGEDLLKMTCKTTSRTDKDSKKDLEKFCEETIASQNAVDVSSSEDRAVPSSSDAAEAVSEEKTPTTKQTSETEEKENSRTLKCLSGAQQMHRYCQY